MIRTLASHSRPGRTSVTTAQRWFHYDRVSNWRSNMISRQHGSGAGGATASSGSAAATMDYYETAAAVAARSYTGNHQSTPSSQHVPQLHADPLAADHPPRTTTSGGRYRDRLIDLENSYFIPRVQKTVPLYEPFALVHQSSPLGHTVVVDRVQELVDASVAPLFSASSVEFKFACGGYAYHSSKNPARKTLIESLPEVLFRGPAGQLPLSVNNGSTTTIMKRSIEADSPINQVPAEAFDKLEFGDMTTMACGEDSVVGSTQLLGLADGVSGWSHHTGGHAALWSRLVLHRAMSHFVDSYKLHHCIGEEEQTLEIPPLSKQSIPATSELQTASSIDITKALDDAYVDAKTILTRQQETGSSTIILAALNEHERTLEVLNIGDSSIWVFRNGEVIFTVNHAAKSENCPRQIGTNSTQLPSTMLAPFSIPVEQGDLVLMCSDGVSDNLWINEIKDILATKFYRTSEVEVEVEAEDVDAEEPERGSLQEAADAIVHMATDRSFDNFAVCPYQLNASQFSNGGGKTDDISVLLAEVNFA